MEKQVEMDTLRAAKIVDIIVNYLSQQHKRVIRDNEKEYEKKKKEKFYAFSSKKQDHINFN